VVDGLAIFEGDIVLGKIGELQSKYSGLPRPENPGYRSSDSIINQVEQPCIVRAGEEYRWEDGVIPYRIDINPHTDANRRRVVDRIHRAITELQLNTNLRLVPVDTLISPPSLSKNVFGHRDDSQISNCVAFRYQSNTCASEVGRQKDKAEQGIWLCEGCPVWSIVHEILHTAGMWHEQSRSDRDDFVEILKNNIITGKGHNFSSHADDGVDIGDYDFDSVMHYGATDFGKTDPHTGQKMATIRAKVPLPAGVTMGQRTHLSKTDIAGVNGLYPRSLQLSGGENWGTDAHATSIAFGDVDGDGRDEIGITRKTPVNARYYVFDDVGGSYKLLLSGGLHWGRDAYATSIAFGDVDGDGYDEVGITRHKTNKSDSYYVLDDDRRGYRTLYSGGGHWGSDNYANSIAFGDVDGDGYDEIGITRHKEGTKAKSYYILDPRSGYRVLHSGDAGWGEDNHANSIAFGDVDGDGRDEIGITRYKKDSRANSYYVLDDARNGYKTLHSGGAGWGEDNYATSIAFGDVDGDGRDEVGITRMTNMNERFWVLEDHNEGFRQLLSGGAGWGSSAYATWIAFGDVDGDGRDEVGVTRKTNVNSRYWILEDSSKSFTIVDSGGFHWGSSNFATAIAFGNTNNDRRAEFGVTRRAGGNQRYSVYSVDTGS
jgi:hypothetical protein